MVVNVFEIFPLCGPCGPSLKFKTCKKRRKKYAGVRRRGKKKENMDRKGKQRRFGEMASRWIRNGNKGAISVRKVWECPSPVRVNE
jgi:hypothetical protein